MVVLFALMNLIDTGGKARARLDRQDRDRPAPAHRHGPHHARPAHAGVRSTRHAADHRGHRIVGHLLQRHRPRRRPTRPSGPGRWSSPTAPRTSGSIVQKLWEPTNTARPWTYPDAPPDPGEHSDRQRDRPGRQLRLFSYYAFDTINTPDDSVLPAGHQPGHRPAARQLGGQDHQDRHRPQGDAPEPQPRRGQEHRRSTNTVHTRNADFSGGDNDRHGRGVPDAADTLTR